MAERFSWVSCIYFTKFKRRRASDFSLYTYIFVYFYAYILKKICELLHTFFICTPLNIHSYIFSFKCYTIIRVSHFSAKLASGCRTAENPADNQTRPGLFLRIDSTGLGDTGND